MEGKGMKKGLVLEGGGLRGVFSAGVIDVLMEEGIEFDGGIGVSAGAAFGCNYKSKQPRRAIRYNLKYAKDPRYSSVRSLLKTGDLFNAQFCYHDIPNELFPFDFETFRENPMEFYLVCTDVETGKPVYHLCDDDSDFELLEWFRASGSMPLVSRIVEIGDRKLLDGGITDSIPLRFMEEQGYERNVVILTRPASYVKEPVSMMRVISRALHKYPETVQAMAKRHIAYNETLAYIRQREAGKYAFVIRPVEDLDIGRVEHDRFKIREAYKAGRKMARRRLPELRRFLAAADNKKAEPELNTNITIASIIKNPPLQEEQDKKELVNNKPANTGSYRENAVAEELMKETASTEAAVKAAPVQAGTDGVYPIPQETKEEISPVEQKKTREDMTLYRAEVFEEVFEEEKPAFDRPVSFVERQEAAARREAEEVLAAEREAEEEAARREAEEKLAAEKAAEEEAVARREAEEKLAAEKAAEEEVAARREAEEKLAAEKAAEEEAARREAEEKLAAEKAAEEEAARREAEEKAAAEKAAAEKAAAEKAAVEKAAAEKAAAEKAAAEEAAAEKALAERAAAALKLAAEKAAEMKAAAEREAAERAAAEKALADKEAAERAAALKAAKESMAAVREAAEKKGMEGNTDETTAAGSPIIYHSRRQKKTWKPGNMTSLKEQNKEE